MLALKQEHHYFNPFLTPKILVFFTAIKFGLQVLETFYSCSCLGVKLSSAADSQHCYVPKNVYSFLIPKQGHAVPVI